MKRMIALLLFAAAIPAVASAQGTTRDLMPGPYAERDFRRAYAPVDRVLGAIGPGGYYDGYYGGLGYGQNGRTGTIATGAMTGMVAGAGLGAAFGHSTRSALIGAGVGAAAGGLFTYAATRRTDQAVYAADGGRPVVFAAPKPQKPLDCQKPAGKRGKNEAACAAAEAEFDFQQKAAQRQACLANLAASPWRLRNGSDRFPFEVTDGGQPMTICGEPVVLRPLQTIRIFPPDGQIGGFSFGANASGEKEKFDADIQAVNKPGFIGFVLMAPIPGKEVN